MRENRLSGLMRGGKQTVIGTLASQSVASCLLYTMPAFGRMRGGCQDHCELKSKAVGIMSLAAGSSSGRYFVTTPTVAIFSPDSLR